MKKKSLVKYLTEDLGMQLKFNGSTYVIRLYGEFAIDVKALTQATFPKDMIIFELKHLALDINNKIGKAIKDIEKIK